MTLKAKQNLGFIPLHYKLPTYGTEIFNFCSNLKDHNLLKGIARNNTNLDSKTQALTIGFMAKNFNIILVENQFHICDIYPFCHHIVCYYTE